jgi:2-polyprenyl-3-methyl-5-hydroxy-6-metoxy-1,4-benzoquinol methylase
VDNTENSFKDKWEKNEDLAFSETLNENSEIHQWILNRNGFKDSNDLKKFLNDKKKILDAGCGNGRVTALLRMNAPENSKVHGIDLVSSEVAKNNFKKYSFDSIEVTKKNLLDDLTDLGKFDFIYCQEVLHHTENPHKAFLNLCDLLDDNGEIAIYVYKQKAPIREFVDDYIRDRISPMNYSDAIKVCNQITELGKALSEMKIKIKVPAVDVLDIKEGDYELQRFIYHFFMKCFWNPELSYDDNSVINYDWYHPQLCTRHTTDEIEKWFTDAGLEILHVFTDFYGITVRGKKK